MKQYGLHAASVLLAMAFGNTHAQERIVPRIIAPLQAKEEPIRFSEALIRTDITGNTAVTEVELGVFNPNNRVLEGSLEFPLAENQSVIGFALDIQGNWRSAVPVEKPRAQQVFEDITRRGVDPGLLEKTQGNNYKLRVYPLPPKGARKVRLRILETLHSNATESVYRLPLNFSDSVDLELKLNVQASQATLQSFPKLGKVSLSENKGLWKGNFKKQNYTGFGTLEIHIPKETKPRIYVQDYGQRYVLAQIPKTQNAKPKTGIKRVDLLWDSSLSGLDRNMDSELKLLDRYFKTFPNITVRLIRFRDMADKPKMFVIQNGNWNALKSELRQTVFDGTTRFSGLECAVQQCSGVSERLLFTDGIDHWNTQKLTENVRVYTITSSKKNNPARLKFIASETGAQNIDLGVMDLNEATKRLTQQRFSPQNIDISGGRRATVTEDDAYWFISYIASEESSELKYRLGGEEHTLSVPSTADQNPWIAQRWALATLDRLSGEPEINSAEIRRLGKSFGLATPETSLIVLDRAEDYVRYDIDPPKELLAEYRRLKAVTLQDEASKDRDHQSRVLDMIERYEAWWKRDFPKSPRPQPKVIERDREMSRPAGRVANESGVAAPAPSATMADSAEREKSNASSGTSSTSGIRIQLQKWTSDAPYVSRLKKAKNEDLYKIYLDERADYLNSTAFFLDVSDEFFSRSMDALGLRILSNLAEMELENRAVLRILGYRYLQQKRPDLAAKVFEDVERLAPYEPQTYRDLGLAYAQMGARQKAIETLYEVVRRSWDARFPEIERIALNEINAIIYSSANKLDTRFMDPRYVKNLPIDLRVVLTWDADNTDIDLWITDPNGEKVYYGSPLSYAGGQISKDFTRGYGPEEYSLKRALPGKYLIETNYYGNTQQILAGAVTVQAKLIRNFGTAKQAEELITLRLKDKKETVLIGTFEVK
ncbi:MAG: VIT domain-containing protein [Deinococcaceae bacterium]